MAKNVADVMLSAAKIAKIKDKDGEEFYAVFGDYCKNPDSDVAEAIAIYCEDKGKAVQSLSDVTYKKMKYSSKLANEAPYVYIGTEYNIVNDGQLNFKDFALQLHKDMYDIPDYNPDERTLSFLQECKFFAAATKSKNSLENPICIYGFCKRNGMDVGSRYDLVERWCEANGKNYSEVKVTLDDVSIKKDISFEEMQGVFNYTTPGVYFDVHSGEVTTNTGHNWDNFIKSLPNKFFS